MAAVTDNPSVTLPRDPASDVGSRLKMLRDRYGLSQRELAKRTGLTNGSVSLIEQNEVSPSIASLKKILSGFPMSLAEFFALEVKPPEQVFYRSDELAELGHGLISLRQIDTAAGKRKLQILHEHYEPGADTGDTMLTHVGEEAGIVVSGEVEITVGNRKQVLKAGEAYYFDSRIPHRFRNVGRARCELVSVCTPPSF